jgi:hypothetical protein
MYYRLSQTPTSLMVGMSAPNAVKKPLHANHVPKIHSAHLIGPAPSASDGVHRATAIAGASRRRHRQICWSCSLQECHSTTPILSFDNIAEAEQAVIGNNVNLRKPTWRSRTIRV